MASSALVSSQNHVESPFIIVKIGNFTFGHCSKTYLNELQNKFNITYPNYMKSLNISKVNGAVNRYVLVMTYAITPSDDPNRLEKVFSSISKTRTIKLSYGDWNAPAFIYKEEEAVITKLSTNVDMSSSSITYTIHCTSASVALSAVPSNFPARFAKPSDVIIELLLDVSWGLTDIYTGMRGMGVKRLAQLIARDDIEVQLEAKTNVSLLDYINYLVNCMVYYGDEHSKLKTSCYFWSSYDDIGGTYGGNYFKVVRVPTNTSLPAAYNTYEIDIGYPTSDCVMSFNINNDDSWSLLYDYSSKIAMPKSSYHIDDLGNIVQEEQTSLITNSKVTFQENEQTRNWWSLVTQFPISATLTMKGLLRPAMLMSVIKINTYFYGRKHISSGNYIITKQDDVISNSGYRTTLTLIRIGGDEHFV